MPVRSEAGIPEADPHPPPPCMGILSVDLPAPSLGEDCGCGGGAGSAHVPWPPVPHSAGGFHPQRKGQLCLRHRALLLCSCFACTGAGHRGPYRAGRPRVLGSQQLLQPLTTGGQGSSVSPLLCEVHCGTCCHPLPPLGLASSKGSSRFTTPRRPTPCSVAQGPASVLQARRTPVCLPPPRPQSPGSFRRTSSRSHTAPRPPSLALARGNIHAGWPSPAPSLPLPGLGSLTPAKAAGTGLVAPVQEGPHRLLWNQVGFSQTRRVGLVRAHRRKLEAQRIGDGQSHQARGVRGPGPDASHLPSLCLLGEGSGRPRSTWQSWGGRSGPAPVRGS